MDLVDQSLLLRISWGCKQDINQAVFLSRVGALFQVHVVGHVIHSQDYNMGGPAFSRGARKWIPLGPRDLT